MDASTSEKIVSGKPVLPATQKPSDNQQTPDQNLLEAVFNTSTLGIHVLESIRDNNGIIVDFYIRLTNTMSDKIAGRKVSGMRMLEGWPHTKEIGLFDKFIGTVETGVPVDYEQLYEGDGVRAWFRWLASKFNDGLYVTIEDISERKKGEEVLQFTANKLQSILDGVPAIIALLEARFDDDKRPVDFIVSSANESMARFSNCPVDELIGKTINDLYPEAFRGELKDSYLKVLLTGIPMDMEFLYPGINRWFSIQVTKQIGWNGLVVVAMDITEKKKAEEERRQVEILTSLDKVKTEFFSNVSHELRTPLALILGPLEELASSRSFSRLQSLKLEIARRNALRLQKLVNSLLDFSRIESGRFETIFQPTDLAEFTKFLTSSFQSAFEKAGLKVIVKIEPAGPVYVNRNLWEKIVFNLLSNALKFTLKGEVEIIFKSSRNHVQLHICDTGIGISPENFDRIFDRFTRIENVKARTYEGSGIGLALVKELVAMHGGSIKVKSKLGVGSEFIVAIPKGKKHLPAKMIHEFNDSNYRSQLSESFSAEAHGWLGIPSTGTQTKRCNEKPLVLLVDDNSDLREYIKSILSYNFEIMEAGSGSKAMALIQKGIEPHLVLADVMMPEMNGYEFLNAVRKTEFVSHVPFIFLSAKASEQDRINGLRRGADHYLVKPFSAEELFAVVDAAIRNQESRIRKISESA